MFCPKCGKINPDDSQICSGCNAELSQEKTDTSKSKKGKILKTVIWLLAIAALICIVILIFNGCGRMQLPEEKMTF